MTDGQLLLAVFAAFYLAECLHWLPLHSTVLSTWATRRGWVAGSPSPLVSASGSGLAWAWPFPPLGSFFVTQPWPVIPDAQGLWIGPGQLLAGKRLEWTEIKPKIEQRTVKLAPGAEVQCSSRPAAEMLLAFLTQTAELKPGKRSQAVEAYWKASLNVSSAKAAMRRFRHASWGLRMPCLFVFMMTFCWLPYVYWRFGSTSPRLIVGLASLLLMNTLVAFTWRFFVRRLFPEGKRSRWGEVLHLIFMPAHTIRALDVIGVEVMAGIHPLAAASAVLKPEELKLFATQTWLEWKWRPANDPLAEAVGLILPRIEKTCKRLGYAVSDLETPPEKQGEAASYCPRCQTQFTLSAMKCEQCGGIQTQPWPADQPGP